MYDEGCLVEFFSQNTCNIKIAISLIFTEDSETVELTVKDKIILSEGWYSLLFSADGFCSEEHLLNIKEDDYGQCRKLNISLKKKHSLDAEFNGTLYYLPDKLEKYLYNDDVANKLKNIQFNTPGFLKHKGELQFTTFEEAKEFVLNAERECGLINVYFENEVPVVIVGKSVKHRNAHEHIAQVKENGKLNVMYQAQIHGSEPASGEGALAIIEAIVNGELDDLLCKLNLVILPTCNMVGMDKFTRKCEEVDLNRDGLALESENTFQLHKIFFALMPEVVIDAHTFTRANSIKQPVVDRATLDVRLSSAQSQNIYWKIRAISSEVVNKVHRTIKNEGLRVGYYSDSVDPTTSRNFYGLYNTCSFLLESEGSRSGRMHFKRNVWSQFKSVIAILEAAIGLSKDISVAVKEGRNKLVSFESDKECFILEHERSTEMFFETLQERMNLDGSVADKNFVIKFPKWNIIANSTVKPAAYIIDDNINKDKIKQFLGKHEIEFIDKEECFYVCCTQFYKLESGNIVESDFMDISFEKGALIVPVNQVASNIICTLLEPASADAKVGNGSLIQIGLMDYNRDNSINLYKINDLSCILPKKNDDYGGKNVN